MPHRPTPTPGTLIRRALVAFSALAVLGQLLPPPGHDRPGRDRSAQDETAPFPRRGAYLGKELCKDCHEDKWDELAAAAHGDLLNAGLLHGCETCHGPGKAHGDDEDNDPAKITHPPGLPAAKQRAICGQCHLDQMRAHGGDPEGFVVAGKGCTSCHRVHAEREPAPHPGVRLRARVDSIAAAEPVGASKCVECHPLRDSLLKHSHHASLAAARDAKGCESCHGNGSLHVETGGLARLITRPDRATDGVATCRACHEEVHPTDFHWHGERKPLLSNDLTCASCHEIHAPRPGASGGGGGPGGAGSWSDDDAASLARYLRPDEPTNAMCASCHAPAFDVLAGTIHESLGGLDTKLDAGCGSCHAGAAAHARAGGRKELVDSLRGSDASHQLATCAQCHDGEPHLRHVRAGMHFRSEVTCLTCHSPAAPKGKTRIDAEKKCASCHQSVAAQFRMPNHHPVPEGHMACSDCHEPHSARPRLRDLELTERRCVECHKQYRGPFVFAHQASRTDGCVACHTPHGASNRRMLKQHRTQQNCLQCHADFPAFHDQTPGAVFTNCLSCHTEVHGSNHSRYFFR